MGLYGPIAMLWNGGADQLKFLADQLILHGCVHFTNETCVCGFKLSKRWSFGPIRNDARPIVAAGRPRMNHEGVHAPSVRLDHPHLYHTYPLLPQPIPLAIPIRVPLGILIQWEGISQPIKQKKP